MFDATLREIWSALDGPPALAAGVRATAQGALPSVFAVTDLAAASIAAAGLAVAEYRQAAGDAAREVVVDRRLASFWFQSSLRPQGWTPPPLWDPLAGDYPTRDGWIRLHTNAPQHRAAALAALGCAEDRAAADAAVKSWRADDLETAVVAAGGCAAAMRPADAWRAHPQGLAANAEPLMATQTTGAGRARGPARPDRPLEGLRVLDCTRILAGPVATRFLAAYGADVLRIDPPGWEEPSAAPEVALGKRCARLDLKTADGLARFGALMAQADVFVHGYRADALERLGLGAAARQALRPGLIDVSLDAYGWRGPWRDRRGFDSLVQMSCGIAEAGMVAARTGRPHPLPAQALDHATGYLMAAAAVRALTRRLRTGEGTIAHASLARTASLLMARRVENGLAASLARETDDDLAPAVEANGRGPARRLKPPLAIDGAPMRWALPAPLLGSSPPEW